MSIPLSPEVLAAAVALIYLAAVAAALEALVRARTAQGSIAWVVSLLTLPYLSLPAYLIFGRNRFDGYLRERRQIEALISGQLKEARSELHDFSASDTNKDFYRSLHRLARLPTVRGNRWSCWSTATPPSTASRPGIAVPRSTTSCSSSISCATTPWAAPRGDSRRPPAPACASTSL
jgi:hypothetical protein